MVSASTPNPPPNLALKLSLKNKCYFAHFAIFLESLKVLFSYTMKSIFLENKYLMFNKESFVSSHQCNDQCVIDTYLVNKQKDPPLPKRVYCNNFVRRTNVSK